MHKKWNLSLKDLIQTIWLVAVGRTYGLADHFLDYKKSAEVYMLISDDQITYKPLTNLAHALSSILMQ